MVKIAWLDKARGRVTSSILSSTSFLMGKTFWGVVSAAVEQSRRKANMVAQGDGKFDPRG